MAFLEENCVLDILTSDIPAECNSFSCGDDDMDEFFRQDVLDYTRYKMGKSYCNIRTRQASRRCSNVRVFLFL